MRDGAILQAAMDIVDDIEAARRPAEDVLRAWGRAHRFAGSGDRARIADVVYGVYRRRAECAHRMGAETPRALVLGRTILDDHADLARLEALCTGTGHDPASLSAAERAAVTKEAGQALPDWVRLNVPAWMLTRFDARFDPGEGLPAMAGRAPVDVRTNRLKAARETVREALNGALAPRGWRLRDQSISPDGLRLEPFPTDNGAAGHRARTPDLTAFEPFRIGQFDIQDEGSQIAAHLSCAAPGETVIDLCAGAGGKTLALGAMMAGKGRLLAFDTAAGRLQEARARLTRAGLQNVTPERIRPWAPTADGTGDPDLGAHEASADLVFVDAPCSGSGTWRRRPEARWHLSEGDLEALARTQGEVLDRAARLVRPGGRLLYVTCSLFEAENSAPVHGFLDRHPGFSRLAPSRLWASSALADAALEGLGGSVRDEAQTSLLLAPHSAGTDGFFCAALRRSA